MTLTTDPRAPKPTAVRQGRPITTDPADARRARRRARRARRAALLALGIRVGSANVRGGFHRSGRVRGLPIPADERIVLALHRANGRGITLMGGQEVSGLQVRTVAATGPDAPLPRWNVVAGTPNATRRGRTLGNAIFYRTDEWRLLDRDEVTVRFKRGVVSRYIIPPVLHFPVGLFGNLRTGERVRLVDFHFPAGRTRSAQAAKATCAAAVRAYYRMHKADGVTFVAVGDRNNAQLLDGWSSVESGVDVVASPDVHVDARDVDSGYRGLVSDHHNGVSGVLRMVER